MELRGKKITVHDMTLRDGMHPKRHLMTLEQMKTIATGLDAAGVPLIEVTHGDGLGGASVNYGFPAHSDEEYLGTVIPLMKQAKVSALLLPGIGTVDHLKMAHELGVSTIRVATHCTEADVSEQHIGMARKLGMDTVGFLMMAHMNSPEGLVKQARLMESYGANCIYVTDSAGHLLPDTVKARLAAVREALKPETELGFHGHHNLAMGVANSLAALEVGATRIDAAGVPLIEVTHGDGLGGSSVNYGFPAHSDEEYLGAVIPRMKQAKVSALLLPGIGTVDHLKMAKGLGVSTIRVATHCTEADVSEQHITMARKLEMDTVGFLMMAHMASPQKLVEQAKLMEGYGANCIYITDSAGYMLPDDVRARFEAVRAALKPETELGFHGHHNMAMGVANSIVAIEAGANRIDAASAGLGAGAGNTPMEVFIAVCDRMGIVTGVDTFKISDVAEDRVVPIMDHAIRIDRDALTLGYAGVYSSFLLFAKRAEKKYGVSARELLVELGRKGMVGGQEDMIEDTAMTLARERGLTV